MKRLFFYALLFVTFTQNTHAVIFKNESPKKVTLTVPNNSMNSHLAPKNEKITVDAYDESQNFAAHYLGIDEIPVMSCFPCLCKSVRQQTYFNLTQHTIITLHEDFKLTRKN